MSIRSRIIGILILSLAAFVVVCAVYQLCLGRLLEARRWVEHTQTVLERLEQVVSLCKDLETGQRGFVLTGKEEFLAPYNRALGKISPLTAQLRTLTSDNPAQQKRLDRLEELESVKIAFVERSVALARANQLKASGELVATGIGKKAMDDIRALVNEMQDEERRLLAERSLEAERLAALVSGGTIMATTLTVVLVIASGSMLLISFGRSIQTLQVGLDRVGRGDLDFKIATGGNDEFSRIAAAFNDMAVKLKTASDEMASQSWLNRGLSTLGQLLQGERDFQHAGQKVLTELANALGSRHGMFYLSSDNNGSSELSLLGSYAHSDRKSLANSFGLGQGLVGQCALEKQRILLTDAPDDYVRISSGVGGAKPRNIVVVPVVFEGHLKAVIEQASFREFTPMQLQYLEQAANTIGVIFNNIQSAQHTERLLQQEQLLSEELQAQQEILAESNSKLEEQTAALQASEEELKQQQEELQQINEELEERARIQARQNAELETKNSELEELRVSLEEKAQQLSVSSKYKSEFLSNMSHELRTPLNSLLILSRTLFENVDGNLTPMQVKYAKTIHEAGSDLLVLIDDVLDISKIEAGAVSIEIAEESVRDLCMVLESNFSAIAREKGLNLVINLDPSLPRFIRTDGRRLLQILKNVVSNAVKFTEAGSVEINVEPTSGGWGDDNPLLSGAGQVVVFRIVDTGIGIAREKQRVIFEAFQQADGTTNRKYGGSGLGLAISTELARLLGGEIRLESEPGQGSTFHVYMPIDYRGPIAGNAAPVVTETEPLRTAPATVFKADSHASYTTTSHDLIMIGNHHDDRSNIESGDKILLVVQEESELGEQVHKLAHERGFKVLRASQGKAAFALVQRFKPDAIILDVSLPDREGWIFLDRLKRESVTRHIPVHVFSNDDRVQQARRLGAVGYSNQPVSQQNVVEMLNKLKQFVSTSDRKLLIVEDNNDERQSMEGLLAGNDVSIASVETGKEALQLLKTEKFDCMIVDLGLPDMSGFELLQEVQKSAIGQDLPIIVHTCRSLSSTEEADLKRVAETIIIKGARSTERLLDETTLFLHRVETNLPEQKRKILAKLHLKDELLSGRRVLIVDDDMRHVFAITSLLESCDMKVSYAENGKQAVDMLAADAGFDIVLMDLMMPTMDGLDAMRAIRKMEGYGKLPIIALTAKAMKGDREHCIDAGASDYLAKPIDSSQLLSLLRVWLY